MKRIVVCSIDALAKAAGRASHPAVLAASAPHRNCRSANRKCERFWTLPHQLQETAMWFINVCAADKLKWEDMSPLELRFWDYIYEHYKKWRKSRRLN